jgi:predicted nucleic acid-binding protein
MQDTTVPAIDGRRAIQELVPVPTGKLVSDAYLAAFSVGSSRRLVTLDRGFLQFEELDVEIPGKRSN